MSDRLEFLEGDLIGRNTDGVIFPCSGIRPVPPNAIPSCEGEMSGKDNLQSCFAIRADTDSPHGETRILLQIASQMVDILIIDDTCRAE